MMKQKICVVGLFLSTVIFSVGCGGKKLLSDNVILKQESVEIGQNVKLEDLFTCNDGVKIGIKNSNEFNNNKAGTYALEVVVEKDGEQETKNYMVKVVDNVPPEIKLKNSEISLYKGDKFSADKYAQVTDNSGEKIEAEIIENNVDCSKAGNYTVKYTAKDSSGNESAAELKVIVKNNFSYKEMLRIIKELLKKKEYSRLTIDQDTTRKIIYISLKRDYYISNIKLGMELFCMEPYIGFYKDKKKWTGNYHVKGYLSSSEKYVKPGKCFLTSSNGKESTEIWSYETDYDSGYVQCFDVNFQYSFVENQIDNVSKILQGTKIKAVSYENAVNTKYVYSFKNKDIKSLNQLAAFCNEAKNNF